MAARQIEAQHLPQTIVLTKPGDGTDLVSIWEQSDAEWVVLIDAASSGTEPGTVRRINLGAQEIDVSETLSSTHGFGVAQAVELARVLGQLPAHLILYTVEGQNFTIGNELSPQVQRALDFVTAMVSEEIRSLTDC